MLTSHAFGTTTDRLKEDLLACPRIWTSPLAWTLRLLWHEFSGHSNHIREHMLPKSFRKKVVNFLTGEKRYLQEGSLAERALEEIRTMKGEGVTFGVALHDLSKAKLEEVATRLRGTGEMAPKTVFGVGEFRRTLRNRTDAINTVLARKKLGWTRGGTKAEAAKATEKKHREFAALFIVLGMEPGDYRSAAPLVKRELLNHLSRTRPGAEWTLSDLSSQIPREVAKYEHWITILRADNTLYKKTLAQLNAAIPERSTAK